MSSNNVRRRRSHYHYRGPCAKSVVAKLGSCFLSQGVNHEQDKAAVDLLLGSVLSKFCPPSKDGTKARKERALAKWFKCEERNRLINETLMDRLQHGGAYDVFHVARRKIGSLLGEFDPDEFLAGCDFGPGATALTSRRLADRAHKFQGNLDTTIDCYDLACSVVRSSPMWWQTTNEGDGIIINQFSRVVTVPKNAETDRVIAVEPSLNMFCQKGLGSMIRRRLKRVGVNLDDQSLNQKAAKAASETTDWSTLDLSSASDTISKKIVQELIPAPWLRLLDQTRTPFALVDGVPVELQKWSSMGNGYTFELESLIFWALCAATLDVLGIQGSVRVYGDDIIVPRASVRHVIGLLVACGFSVNDEKSHVDGPYHESCGKHFYEGTDVTPFFIRREVATLQDLFLLHNNIVRWSRRQQYNLMIDWDKLNQLLSELRSYAPKEWERPRLPDGFGDGAFIGTFDQCCPTPYRSRKYAQWEGFRVEVLAETVETSKDFAVGLLLKELHALWRRSAHDRLTSVCEVRDEAHGGVFIKTRKGKVTLCVRHWDQ